MKNTKRITPEEAVQMARSDRNRILFMAGTIVVLGIGYVFSGAQEERYRAEDDAVAGEKLPDNAAEQKKAEAVVVVPDFDIPDMLEAIRDATPAERVIVDGDALTAVFNYGRLLTPRHYEAAGLRELTPELRTEVRADPSAHRVKPFRVRGKVEAIGKRRRSETLPEEWAGSLRLEDDSFAHFVVLEVPEDTSVGDFIRVDGMFLKIYSTEAPSEIGGRLEGPLLLGPEAVPSYAPVNLDEPVELTHLHEVRDDSGGDVSGVPMDALWELMSLAKAGNQDLDWATVPAIDGQVIGNLLADGESYRGKPFRLELSRNMGGWTEKAGENPLRLERWTRGWIGNQNWKGQVPIVAYFAPTNQPELRDRNGVSKYLTGRGYFFKNHVYERGGGDIGRAPLFVMETVDVFIVEPDEFPIMMMWGAMIGAMLMIALLWFLLVRDRKNSAALQKELVRRRRARRAQLPATVGPAVQPES
ncbi:MAG: hypothetical protein ACI841_005427 [Planctomycetota bacterium]|jgi:hypothetical protein